MTPIEQAARALRLIAAQAAQVRMDGVHGALGRASLGGPVAAAPPQGASSLLPGWKWVPVEPTEEMVRAACDCQEADPEDGLEAEVYHFYRAMLDASPLPAPQEPVDIGQMEYRGNTVSYMYDRARAYGDEIMRCWFVLKDAGLHPGRTDDRLSDVLKRALYAAPAPVSPEIAQLGESGSTSHKP